MWIGANIDAIGEAEKMGISQNRAVTYENDCEGVALNYEVVGSAVRRAVSRKRASLSEPIFEDDWSEEISDYHESKSEKRS